MIVVDDGSTDKTAEIATSAGATVIRHDKNRGKGAAMKTAGSQADGEIIVFIDGDGQHNPSDIPKLIGAYTGRKSRLCYWFEISFRV